VTQIDGYLGRRLQVEVTVDGLRVELTEPLSFERPIAIRLRNIEAR